MPGSEVARLKQRIDQEAAAIKLALTGYAQAASHEIITHHYETLGACMDKLREHIGQEGAIQAVAEALDRHL